MANFNSEILDANVRHQIYLQRYSSSIVNDVLPLLIKSEAAAKEIFDQRLSRILELGFDRGPTTSARTARLISDLGAEIEQLRIEQAFSIFGEKVTDELDDFAGYEANWVTASLNETASNALEGTPFVINFQGVAAEQVIAAATAKPFTISPGKMAKTLGDYLAGMSGAERQRIEDAVTTGVVNGQTNREIVRSVWGTIQQRKTGEGSAAVITTRRGAEMLVRTAVSHIGETARGEVYKQNSDLFNKIRYLATLDSRTTPRCIDLDNTVWPIDSGPRPPQHARCRSVTTPELKTYRELGINVDEPAESSRSFLAIPAKMNVTQYRAQLRREGLTKAQQDKIIRNLSGQTDDPDFGSFLSRQTKEFQETVLGKTRTELYRKGDLTLKELISPQGDYYTLAQLRELQPEAFTRAGIE